VFPRYDPTAETALLPIARATGLQRLLKESLVLPELLDRGSVESLVRWMRNVECFELPMSSLEEAVALVQTRAARGEEGLSPAAGLGEQSRAPAPR
jgi:hypothetical protein